MSVCAHASRPRGAIVLTPASTWQVRAVRVTWNRFHPSRYEVQGSADGIRYSALGVQLVPSADDDSDTLTLTTRLGDGARARHVRVFMTVPSRPMSANSGYNISEFAVCAVADEQPGQLVGECAARATLRHYEARTFLIWQLPHLAPSSSPHLPYSAGARAARGGASV